MPLALPKESYTRLYRLQQLSSLLIPITPYQW
jgi:hypothetical protein